MAEWLDGVSATSNPSTKRRDFRAFTLAIGAFLIIAPIVLWALDFYSARTYFIVTFIWFLVCREIFALPDSESDWWDRIWWVKIVGWVILAYIVFERAVAILS